MASMDFKPPLVEANEAQRIMARSMSEKALSDSVVALATVLGWEVARWPTFRATSTYAGVPDLLLARDGRVWVVELKSETGKLSVYQEQWAAALGDAFLLWRPSDWLIGRIEAVLRR